jgi:hypothetical protein
MAQVTQAVFDDLLKQRAIAEDGVILRNILHDNGVYAPGDDPFVVEGSEVIVPDAPTQPDPVEAPKPVATRSPRAAKPKGGDA